MKIQILIEVLISKSTLEKKKKKDKFDINYQLKNIGSQNTNIESVHKQDHSKHIYTSTRSKIRDTDHIQLHILSAEKIKFHKENISISVSFQNKNQFMHEKAHPGALKKKIQLHLT